MSEAAWLAFRPRDTVLVRDGRSFDASADQIAHPVRPWPSTIGGATRAAFGDDPHLVRGPALGRWTPGAGTGHPDGADGSWDLYFPVPADVVQGSDMDVPYAFRLTAAASAARTDLDTRAAGDEDWRWLTPPADAGPVKPVDGWLPSGVLSQYLAGELPSLAGTPVRKLRPEIPLRPEPRVGLARQPDRQLRSGYLYQATHLRPEEGWAFLAECEFAAGRGRVPAGPVPLGGRSRLADVEPAPNMVWPARPEAFENGRLLVYLATPALWPDGWRFPVPADVQVVAAAVGEPEPVATTSPRLGWEEHRRLHWAVPAGSVYLLQFSDNDAAASWAAAHHAQAYGRADRDPLRTVGFGVILTGVWK
jgi:CRISPR type III-B/RAMP module-associated protein Cmr3